MTPPYGLILAGGRSRRMGRDKAALVYHGLPQTEWLRALLEPFCQEIFLSVREASESPQGKELVDRQPGEGPLGAIASAFEAYPEVPWLVVACDLPYVQPTLLQALLGAREGGRPVVSFESDFDGKSEPLCALYEPEAGETVRRAFSAGQRCPRSVIEELGVELLPLPIAGALDNVNTPDEAAAVEDKLRMPWARLQVSYFAQLAEEAGKTQETLEGAFGSLGELYERLRERYGFSLDRSRVRVAQNEEFAHWGDAPLAQAEIAFLPPFAGG
ncbi:MAG: NTP transferase domain-containing protein [Verrucomicrobiota bacterium]